MRVRIDRVDDQIPTFFMKSSNLLPRRESCWLISLLLVIIRFIWLLNRMYSAFWAIR